MDGVVNDDEPSECPSVIEGIGALSEFSRNIWPRLNPAQFRLVTLGYTLKCQF